MKPFEIGTETTPLLTFTVYDSAGAVVDLTGATVTLTAKSGNSAGFSISCSISSPATAGICTAQLTATDAVTPGLYRWELFIEWVATGLTVITKQYDTLRVVERLTT